MGVAVEASSGYMCRNLVWGMKEVLPLPILCKSSHSRIVYRLEKRQEVVLVGIWSPLKTTVGRGRRHEPIISL